MLCTLLLTFLLWRSATEPAASFFINDTATTEIYTLSLHDALPISCRPISSRSTTRRRGRCARASCRRGSSARGARSEEHTSELQSRPHLVCRLLLEKKNRIDRKYIARLAMLLTREIMNPGVCPVGN